MRLVSVLQWGAVWALSVCGPSEKKSEELSNWKIRRRVGNWPELKRYFSTDISLLLLKNMAETIFQSLGQKVSLLFKYFYNLVTMQSGGANGVMDKYMNGRGNLRVEGRFTTCEE